PNRQILLNEYDAMTKFATKLKDEAEKDPHAAALKYFPEEVAQYAKNPSAESLDGYMTWIRRKFGNPAISGIPDVFVQPAKKQWLDPNRSDTDKYGDLVQIHRQLGAHAPEFINAIVGAGAGQVFNNILNTTGSDQSKIDQFAIYRA